ncbi:MAG: DNA polymerase III subunit delta [Deltaproteobacteria bacterium HGW-Deltaproteobacteria-10]|nr:MAG: DNA polymerase III subunit delta [Deltaproteobacteria bacterium HGW-Deltaproteobacteria-10]
MASEKLLADLKKGVIAPCYLLYGEEEYLITETLQQIIDLIIPPNDRDFGLFYLDGENTDIDSLIEYILTPSLLGGRKVVVVRNTTIFQSSENLADLVQKIRDNIDDNSSKAAKYFLTFLKLAGFSLEDLRQNGWRRISDGQWSKVVAGDAGDDREKWLPRILEICSNLGIVEVSAIDKMERLETIFQNGLPSGNCLIFTAEAVDKRRKIYKMIAQQGIVLNFSIAKGEAAQKEVLQRQIQKLLERYKKKLSPAAWVGLGKKTGFELRRSIMEMEKLIFFVGDRPVIEEGDVEEVVGKTREDSIFDLTTALSEKNQLAALHALKALLDQGLHHLMILTMIVREIRFLLHAKILINTGKLPKFNSSMEYGWFSKNIHPALSELSATQELPKDFLTGKHPFVVFNALRNCGRFSYPVLIDYLDDLLEIDRGFKSSARDPQLLLENFLIKACAKA